MLANKACHLPSQLLANPSALLHSFARLLSENVRKVSPGHQQTSCTWARRLLNPSVGHNLRTWSSKDVLNPFESAFWRVQPYKPHALQSHKNASIQKGFKSWKIAKWSKWSGFRKTDSYVGVKWIKLDRTSLDLVHLGCLLKPGTSISNFVMPG